ncbi:MAG: group II intron reverse transcriptase/maturase [Candidatus Omnitrophota bacterium]
MQLFAEVTESMGTKLGFVAERAKRDKTARFGNLMHLISEESLKASYRQTRKDGAVGVDGKSWEEYGEGLEKDIKGLMERMKAMSYRPQAVRRVHIPKANGGKRPLGIPAVEDKVVGKAMSWVMEAIYEQDFHEDSYGFRRGRSQHQALKRINDLITTKPINYVIEVDVKGYFDNVDHEKLVKWLKVRISDERFVRYVVRFLKAGYMEERAFHKTERGTPQGGSISPMIANVFLHYVVDEWFEREMKPRMKGQGYEVRYCDDFVILVQNKDDAGKILRELKKRLEENGLAINAGKTQLISFGRYEKGKAKAEGRGTNTFDFLGFTHFIGVSRTGKFKVGRRTSRERFRQKIVGMNRWLAAVRNAKPVREWWREMAVKMKGHYGYYGVSDNSERLAAYYEIVVKLAYKWLNRCSQRSPKNWEEFREYLSKHPLPKPRIVHRLYIPYWLCKPAY